MSSAAMSLGQISHKPNEMDGVFTARQKFGSYKVITPEKKKFLKAEFMKVIYKTVNAKIQSF